MKPAELVELVRLDPTLKLDIRYATPDNFVGCAVYPEPRAFLQKPAAEALLRAHRALRSSGHGLLVFDGYRPWSVTRLFWESVTEDRRRFVADPAQGSRHNRGCAVDLTLFEISTGLEVKMPSGFDEMTERSAPGYTGGTAASRRSRDLLIAEMERQGFQVNPYEWWHFDHPSWKDYSLLDIGFAEIERN